VRSFAILALLVAGARAEPPSPGFVAVAGTRFVVGDRPFAFVGANLEVLHGARNRERAEATLAAARADGLTVGRVWALGEGDRDAPAWRRAELFRLAPNEPVEESFVALDRVLAWARAHDLKLIITLCNHWGDYGGVPQYLRWAGLPESGFAAHDRFFSDDKTRAFYRAHLERIVARVNTVNQIRYADDPTIFAWELMNESSVDSPAGAEARRAWITEMAAFIRARDPHHLITPGIIGYTTRAERKEWLAVCSLPQVDYCDSHLYPQTTDEVATLAELAAIIDDRVGLAHHVARKPIVFGEFGFTTVREAWLGAPRARWFRDFLERVFLDGAEGALVWIYQPWSGHARDFGIYVDRGDTDDVRAELRAVAARVASALPVEKNARLAGARGDRPLYDPYRVARRSGHPRLVDDGFGRRTVELAPEEFAVGRWERVGSWDGGPLTHAYGAGDGFFEWRFAAPAAAARRVEIVARVSSEWPGTSAPPDGGSRVAVRLDGALVGELDAVPDDGAGRVERLTVGDPALVARLRGGAHTLRLEVAPGARANGLCVYGLPTGKSAPPVGESLPIEIVFYD
jgi:mannan endo-1,4-beta-mannosidase